MFDETLISDVMKTLVLRQAEHRGCCTTAKWLVWFHGAGAREAVREARRRGWAEYVDPQGWRATVVQDPQTAGMILRLRNAPLTKFVWEPGNAST